MTATKQPVEVPEFASAPCRRLWGVGGMTRPLSLRDQTDDGLARLRKQVERAVEDGIATPVRVGPIKDEQHRRLRLRMRYGAVDNHVGTDDVHRWAAHDEAPSYALAAWMDLGRCVAGRRHVLDWSAEPRFADWYQATLGGRLPAGNETGSGS